MRKPLKYDNEIRSGFRKFIYRVATKLVDIVDNKYHTFNSTPQINKIVQAVITLMFIFRVRYRNVYHGVHNSIVHRKKFAEFCKKFYDQEKLPYFFTFLLNLSMKFEMFLYLREEGHNHFGSFAFIVGEDAKYFYFEAKGGAQKLAETADFFLERAQDLQMLVKNEDPLSDELLALDDQLDDINIDDLDPSEYDSLLLLQDIERNLYSGLQKFTDKKVLPLVILRFILHGRVPHSPISKHKKKIPIDKYFNRCLVPEIINGEAFENINRSERLINEMEMNETFRSKSHVNTTSKKKRRNRKKKSKESKESNTERLSEETCPSSEDKNYGDGLEWLRGFDAKTLSLLSDDPNNFADIHYPAEDSPIRKDFDPLSETGATTVSSVNYNLGPKQRETSSNYETTEEENDYLLRREFDPLSATATGTVSSVKYNVGKKRRDLNRGSTKEEENPSTEEENDCSTRREFDPLRGTATGTVSSVKYNLGKKRKDLNPASSKEEDNLPGKTSYSKSKLHGSSKHKGQKEKLTKNDELLDLSSGADETNPLQKLKDTLATLINRAKALHCWEKKITLYLIKEAQVFTEEEVITFSEKIRAIPDKDYINPGEEGDLKQFFEIIKMEDKCDSLYSENDDDDDEDNENENFSGKLPCPEYTEIITENFAEIMICILALSCDNVIRVGVLGNWIPILQDVLLKNKQLTRLFIRYGLNCLLPFLSSHASMIFNDE